MITFRTLEGISTHELLDVFNRSFSDYVVPFSLTKEQLEEKMKGDGVRLELSAGAFENDRMVAFVLHGNDPVPQAKIAYNAGTGVVPDKRGNRLTTELYEYIIPFLKKDQIEKVKLEVITTNRPAVKVYQGIGFKTIRHLHCFQGSVLAKNGPSEHPVRELHAHDWQHLTSFWDVEPSWQNAIPAVTKLKSSTLTFGMYHDDGLIGYIIYGPRSRRVHQLAVAKGNRRKGVGRHLLEHVSNTYGGPISVINVDGSSKDAFEFLSAVGLVNSLDQHEMKLALK